MNLTVKKLISRKTLITPVSTSVDTPAASRGTSSIYKRTEMTDKTHQLRAAPSNKTEKTSVTLPKTVCKVDQSNTKPVVESPTVSSKASGSKNHIDNKPASAESTDKFKKNVVSKVSEVATKTTKPTPESSLLTEAQITKMSDKDYMNEAQLAFFKARLQQLEIDLLKNAGETTEHLRETVLVPDPADRATIEEEHALELRTRDRERKLLKKVQQSIAAIDAGDYGWCEETGEPIGIPRLLARPTATLSLEAQQRRELKQKLYGD